MTTTQRAEKGCLAIVLAAGEGKRMRSSLPKALHKIAGRSMLAHVLDAVRKAGADHVAVVVGPDRADVAAEAARAAPGAKIFVQAERRGTAHAVLAARDALSQGFANVLVVFADTPLVRPETFAALRQKRAAGADVVALGFEPADPTGYGRLLTDAEGKLLAIREHKDASEAERATRLCNAGLMALDGARALELARKHRLRQRPEGILPARRGRGRAARRRGLRHRQGRSR